MALRGPSEIFLNRLRSRRVSGAEILPCSFPFLSPLCRNKGVTHASSTRGSRVNLLFSLGSWNLGLGFAIVDDLMAMPCRDVAIFNAVDDVFDDLTTRG